MCNKDDDMTVGLSAQLDRTGAALVGLKKDDPEFFEELLGPDASAKNTDTKE